MAENKSFVAVDELMPQLSIEQVAAFYDADLPELKRGRNDIRSQCFLNCGKTADTGDRALSIQADHPAKQWRCFEKGCGKSGNLVSLCDFLKPGENSGGRPRGTRFKAIAADMKAMADGNDSSEAVAASSDQASTAAIPVAGQPITNIPLSESQNDRARQLTHLDDKFLLPSDIQNMPPAASKYFRMRRWLTDEVAKLFRMGFLPRDAGGDNSGGTMRDKIVYAFLDEQGRELTWFGRDPAFEDKHRHWQQSAGQDREPQKFRFIKGFQRGLELYGQHLLLENIERTRTQLDGIGLPVVAGPNDVIRLFTLGTPAVALCSENYMITREQAEKAARLARETAGGKVVIMQPCTPAGETGMKQCLGYLSQVTWARVAWTSKMFDGKFQGMEVERLQESEWSEIAAYLRNSERKNWNLA